MTPAAPMVGTTGLERAIALALGLVGFVVAAGVMTDNSLLTHVATGRLIIDGGSVPSTDPYSRFGLGQDWTVQSWLASVVYAVLDRLVGPAAIRAFHGLIGALVGVGLWRLSRPAGHLGTRIGLAAAPLIVGVGLWSPRPLLIGLAALVGLLVVLQDDRPGWLLVPLLWVWGNAHGSFPLAVGLLGLVVVGHWLDDRTVPARVLRLLGWAVVGTIVAAVGPIGPRLLVFPLEVIGRREAMTGVVEWQAPSFSSPWELVWLAIAILPLVAAKRGLGWHAVLPAAVFGVAAALALRNVAPASIVVVGMIAPGLADPARSTPSAGDGMTRGRARLARAIGVAAVTASIVAVATVLTRPGLDLARYPVDEVEALHDRGLLPSADVVVVHREAVGNYLTWRFGDRAMTFVDDRFDFHAEPLLADHRDLLAGKDARTVLDRWQADVVLWEADAPLTDWLTDAQEWSVLRGEEWVVACRLDSPVEAGCRSVDPS